MKQVTFLLFASSLLLTSCQSTTSLTEKLDDMEAALLIAEQELADLKAENAANPAGKLVHVVYLNLKENVTAVERKEIVAAIDDLARIESVHELEIGTFADLGDKRALSDLELVFRMSFMDKIGYESYQAHPIHKQLKIVLKDYLAGAPVIYDYFRLPG